MELNNKNALITFKTTISPSLESSLSRGWGSTNKRGKPGKALVLFGTFSTKQKILPLIVREELPLLLPPKKRYLALVAEERHHGAVVIAGGNGEENVAPPGKQFICSDCSREFNCPRGLGVHVSSHRRRENQLRHVASQPAQSSVKQRRRGVVHESEQLECKWCRRFFKKRGLGRHMRFCSEKKKARVVEDFDLNLLPVEAHLPEELPMLTWHD